MIGNSITLDEAVKCIDDFCPVKIIFNNIVLYDDIDGLENGAPLSVVPDKIVGYKNSIVKSIEIEIVQFHHSIIHMCGEFVR